MASTTHCMCIRISPYSSSIRLGGCNPIALRQRMPMSSVGEIQEAMGISARPFHSPIVAMIVPSYHIITRQTMTDISLVCQASPKIIRVYYFLVITISIQTR